MSFVCVPQKTGGLCLVLEQPTEFVVVATFPKKAAWHQLEFEVKKQ